MDTKEAIRRLKGLYDGTYILLQSNKEALAMAIEALEARDRMEQRMNKIIADEKALDKPSD